MQPKTLASAMGWRSSKFELGLKVALSEARGMTPKFHQELAEHMELCSMLCGSLAGKEVGGEGIHIYAWLSTFAVCPKPSQRC